MNASTYPRLDGAGRVIHGIGAILLVTLVTAGAAACSGGDSQTVDLTMDARIEGDSIVAEGTTDLPDGAVIVYEVTHEDFGTKDDLEDPVWSLFADGSAPVDGGRYSLSAPVADWPAGDVTVWVAFQAVLGDEVDPASGQPASVMERYGEMGANLTGPNVTESAGNKRVEIEATVSLPD
jgi:hypothetical protein